MPKTIKTLTALDLFKTSTQQGEKPIPLDIG
jgi:hypothetical protein